MQARSAGVGDTGAWVLVAAVLGSSMVFLDGSTVNVALPALQASLGASAVDVQWVINGYTLFLAALLMLGGSLGDHLGRRKVFVAGMAVFTLASIWCGVAGNVPQLIWGRMLQGVGGALLTPGSLALINANFDKSRRGQAIGRWAAFSAIASAAGPILGGWLIDTLSWRWIFFVNVPLAVAAVLVTVRHVPESRGMSERGALDFVGATLITLGLGGAIYALLESSVRGWADPTVAGAGVAGLLLIAAFLLVEARSKAPMVPLGLFASKAFSGINAVTLLLYANLAGLTFFLPLFLIQVRGFSATAAGAAGLPLVLLLLFLSGWSGGLYDRIGPRVPISVGAITTAIALGLFALLRDAPNFLVAVTLPMTVMGLGMALLVAPLTTTVMASAPDALAGTASGLNNAVSRAAGLLAIGALGILMLGTFAGELTQLLAATDVPPALQETMLERRNDLAGMRLPDTLSGEQLASATGAVHQAFTTGFVRVLLLMTAVAVVAALLAVVTLPGRRGPAPP